LNEAPVPARRRPRSTRDRILDAADRLFAQRGFDGTSLRALTAQAGVNLAAVNYHFGSKLELLRGALARHVEPINAERLLRLDKLLLDPRGLTVEQVLDALFRPAFEFTHASRKNAREIHGMLALLFREPPELVQPLLGELFETVVERFVAALADLLPALPREVLERRYSMAMGAMIHLLADARLARLDFPEHERVDELVAFVAGALRAPALSTRSAKVRR
jgi:AcrR family transcriptional regulator